MATIGFIGLGIMGRPMVKNLIEAGHTVIAYDAFAKALDSSVADGAQRASSSKDVASRTTTIITMVPDGPQVEEAVLGPGGVLEGAKAGTLIIDMSSINPLRLAESWRSVRGQGHRISRCAGQRRRA